MGREDQTFYMKEKAVPAIEGGVPASPVPLHYSHQYIDDADIQAVEHVLRSDYLTTGPDIDTCEKKLCEVTGARYAVLCANGTAALHIAAMAAGLGEGDEVITTPITFAADANCARYVGAKPVFADINPDTYNLDPASVEERITPSTRAVIAVDFGGQSSDQEAFLALKERYGFVYIEDAAHAIGTRYKGRPVGSFADMTIFSFHAVKTITGGEGGAVVTNDPVYYEKLRLYRTHGITRDPAQMVHQPDGPWYYEQLALAPNYRITDMQAALISSQLDKLPQFAARKKAIVQRYDEAFRKMPGIKVQQEIAGSDTVRHLYILELDPAHIRLDRAGFFAAMGRENIVCNVHYIPIYYFPYYEKLGYPRGLCPNAEYYYDHALTIPLYYAMSDDDVSHVIEAVGKIAAWYAC